VKHQHGLRRADVEVELHLAREAFDVRVQREVQPGGRRPDIRREAVRRLRRVDGTLPNVLIWE